MKKKTQKTPKKYACEKCDFLSSNKKDYKRHLETKKHTILTNTYKILTHKKNACSCGKTYTHRQSLYFHRKKCSKFGEKFEENSENKKENELANPENITKLLKTILQENRELKKEMKNLKITNITNNNKT